MSHQIVVIATLIAKAGKEEDLLKECQALIEPTLKEAPCISYQLHLDETDPKKIMFYEKWESKEDLDKHLQMPYLVRLKELMPSLCEGSPDMNIWKKVI
jgi:quinol monooxygenase YgiN